MTETEQKSAECPSCGHQIGERPVCHHCCRTVARGVSEGVLMLSVLPAALLGVVLLLLGAATETSVSPIPPLGADDAFRHVRVVGTVTNLRYTEGKYGKFGELGVWIRGSDGPDAEKNTLKIKVEGPVVAEMIRRNVLPSRGDVVDAEGTLYAGEAYRLLNLNTARLFTLREGKTAYEPRTVADLTVDPENHAEKSVILRNVVVAQLQAGGKFKVADRGTPERSVLVYGAWVDDLREGDVLTVRGLFTFYERDRIWELKLRRSTDDMVILGGE